MDYPTAITSLIAGFVLEFGVIPIMGVELECYVRQADGAALSDAQFEILQKNLSDIPLERLERERGKGQIELVFRHQDDVPALLDVVTRARHVLETCAKKEKWQLSFDAKPFVNEPGNGQHVHVSLVDAQGNNVFFKRNDSISDPLLWALGGLIATLPESMVVFAPSANAYERFCGSKDAPTTVSWGNNNRTTALRLPESRDGLKHIEHRVPGSDAVLAEVVYAILAGVHYGFTQQVAPPEPVYGDAFLAHYQLPLLPKSPSESQARRDGNRVLGEYYPHS